MDPRKDQAALIIHGAATASAATAGLMAQLAVFGADIPILAAITVGMIVALGNLFGQQLEKKAMSAIVGELLAAAIGVTVAKGLLGLIPGFGNIINAGVAFGVTEVIGWGAYRIFEQGKDITMVSASEIIKLGKKVEKPDTKAILAKMSPSDRQVYEDLSKKLRSNEISVDERERVLAQISQLITPQPAEVR